jgi:hypothetical protein
LANLKDQRLQNPEHLAFDPPALGHVREFQFSLRHNTHPTDTNKSPVQEEVSDRKASFQPLPVSSEARVDSTAWLKRTLGKLQIVLWLIFVALILNLLK